MTNLSDGSGNAVASYHLDAWGNFRFEAVLDQNPNRFAYTGHEFDRETYLYYARARYYDPIVGRFTTQDSFLGDGGHPPSLHRYVYANANPTMFVDPTGHYSWRQFGQDIKWGLDFGVAYQQEFSARAGETVANIATLGGYGGVKKAYAEGRVTATDSFSGVKAYAEGVFNTITLGGGERGVAAYAEGKGASGVALETVVGVGETVLPINEVKTLADSERNAWEKAEAVAMGTAKVAGLLAGGLAAKNALTQRLANKPGIVAESAAGAEATMAPAEGVLPAAKPLPKAGGSPTAGIVPSKRAAPAAGEISSLGRRGGPVRVSADDMQAIAKSVRRQVDKLNRKGAGASGQRFRELVDAGDYRGAGAIAHRRMMKRLKSVDFRTLRNDPILFESGRIYPPPGVTPSRGFSYRIPDIQYGPAGRPGYQAWDFKGEAGGWPYSDPTGQFADVSDWVGSTPTPLYYHWR